MGKTYTYNIESKHNFLVCCEHYDLSPEDYGKEFWHKGGRMKVVGINPRNRKLPIICQNIIDGKLWKIANSVVKTAITGA